MQGRLVVVDTNVLVSGLITSHVGSPPCRIVDEMLHGSFGFLLSLDLLAEYRNVLLRPKIKALHCLTENEVDEVLTTITTNGIMKEPKRGQAQEVNPGDQHIWDLMESASDTLLVTGDLVLKKSLPMNAIVFSPLEFVEKVLPRR